MVGRRHGYKLRWRLLVEIAGTVRYFAGRCVGACAIWCCDKLGKHRDFAVNAS